MYLIIDASSKKTLVAYGKSARIVVLKEWEAGLDLSRELLPATEKILARRRKPRAIFCVTGPGSFTGLRLAVSTANALGCVWQVPVIPVTAFEIYEQAHPEIKPPYQVILDNIKNLVYVKKVKTGQENYAVEEFRIQNSAGRIGGMIGCLGREKLALARRTGFHSEQIAGEKRARLISAVAEKRIKNVKRFVRPLTPLYINPPKITVRK